ncbi:uncharacterized protein LOC114940076 [Nylanderia fulva]|uniref:uncharacterized protein LOC114940076 n=1 Tax=Nylanderia fulva TaxID=613905 RepID=UPI0010FAE66E|nr:uncharacterized protein LOC114940076 [Nylanderia fulva]
MLSQRRRHSRWRMYLIYVAFLALTCNCELASANVPESSSSAPTAKRKSQDIGSLNDFAWQAWLLVDAQNGFQHGVDSATLLRRITPKSVFIAPALPACAEGYRADTMGRCVKSVNIDAQSHMYFLLERLNAMYGNPQAFAKNDQKKSTGPLQLNIPLILSDPKPASTKVEPEETFSMNNPVVVPPRNQTHPDDEEKVRPHEVIAIASAYEMKNDTMSDEKEKLEEKTTLLPGNSSIDDVSEIDQKTDAVVPVADNTNSSEVGNRRIPIDLKTSLNTSSVNKLNASDITKESVSITKKPDNFTELSPTLIFLISSTKLPSVADDDLSVTQNETVSHVTVQMFNVTSNKTTKEVIAVSVPDSALPDKSTEVPSVVTNEQRDNETRVNDETSLESSKLNESQETEFVYDEEEEDAEYPYSTDMPDDEDSMELENEEILSHGEAGMTIPTRNIERLHQQNQTANQKKTLEVNDQIMIRFNDSISTDDKDEAGSNVSSEVSINGDLILETTLLDVNTEKLQVTTKWPDVTRKITKGSDDGPKESFSKSSDTESDLVIFQEVQDTTPTNLHRRKTTTTTEHLTRFENKKHEELERGAAPSSSEQIPFDFPEEHPITETHIPDKEQSTLKESVSQENPKDFQLNVPASDFKQTTMNLGSVEDYVRFPDYAKQPQQDGYVRFPSSEANSIHNLGYKQHSHHPIDDVGPHDGTSTKSSVPVRQKPVYYLPSWKPERLQTDHVPVSEKQKQRPDLLRFWSKMPLIRDPGVYPVDQVPEDAAEAQELHPDRFFRASRKLNRFAPEISPENVNKARAQKQRTSIGG